MSRANSTTINHNRKKTRWKQKYEYMRNQVQQEIPGFSIRSKNGTLGTRLLWGLVNLIVRMTWRSNAPDMKSTPTTVCRTLWTGSDWPDQSDANKWLLIIHERRYLLMLWENRSPTFPVLYYTTHLIHMLFSRSYRQSVMELCWQENLNYYVQSNKGTLNKHAKRQIIRTLSGPEFAFSFSKSEATDCVKRMATTAEQLYKEGELDG